MSIQLVLRRVDDEIYTVVSCSSVPPPPPPTIADTVKTRKRNRTEQPTSIPVGPERKRRRKKRPSSSGPVPSPSNPGENGVEVNSITEMNVQPIDLKSSCLDEYDIPQSVDADLPAQIFAEDVAEAPDNSEPTLPSKNVMEASSESVHSEFSFSDGKEQMNSPDARGPAAGEKSAENTIPLSDLSFDIYEVAYDLTSMSKWELDIRAGAASEAVDEFFRTHWKFPLVENFGHGEIVLGAGEI